jgi:hypothetical protein
LKRGSTRFWLCASACVLIGTQSWQEERATVRIVVLGFDWAGLDVPQVMEMLCTAAKDGTIGRVVEITLAANNL